MSDTKHTPDERLLGSWRFYRSRPMTEEEQRAALDLEPVSAPLGLTEWRTTDGTVYAKGANAVSAQVGINSRAAIAAATAPEQAK